MININCAICESELSSAQRPFHFICKSCKYEKSNLLQTINLHSTHKLIDEAVRKTGLKELRIRNFKSILTNIKALKSSGGTLLDVGSAHGWFLDTVKNDFEAYGIEPDEAMSEVGNIHSRVRVGFFPYILNDEDKFDVIVFNDVFEHIPDIESVIVACRKHLNIDGLLVLNLPNSNGIFYRVAKLFSKMGYNSFFDRMWQHNLPSPHLHYFNLKNLTKFLSKNGFAVMKAGELSTIQLSGLYSRISYVGDIGFVRSILIYLAVVILLPVLKILPSDIFWIISTKTGEDENNI